MRFQIQSGEMKDCGALTLQLPKRCVYYMQITLTALPVDSSDLLFFNPVSTIVQSRISSAESFLLSSDFFPIFTLTVRKERFWQFFLSNGAKLPSSVHTRNKILYLAYSTDVPGLSCKSDLSILPSDLGELSGVFWHLTRVWVCIPHSRCPLLNERAFPARQTRSHTHQNWCWWTLTFLFCVILGALPVVISPAKNDVFMLANKRIWRAASPGHYDWSNVWSLTIRCHSPWQWEDCIQFMQSTPATHDRSKCVIFGKGGGWGKGREAQNSFTWQFSTSQKATFHM